jgi:protein-disulfide isomerase
MENKNWGIGLVVLVLIIGLSAWGFSKSKPSGVGNNPVSPTTASGEPAGLVAKPITGQEVYFDSNAKVMEFYQSNCGWCQKQSEVLEVLAKEGYRVKPMDTAANPNYLKQYNISGTPTLLAPNGDRLEGYVEEAKLREFLDAHK